MVKHQTCRYWPKEKLHAVSFSIPGEIKYIGTGIIHNKLISTIFFDGTLIGLRYIVFLQNFLIIELNWLFPNTKDLGLPENRATTHYATLGLGEMVNRVATQDARSHPA